MPIRIHFEELRLENLYSVSSRLPILCFEDAAERPDQVRGYVHADFMSVYVVRQGYGTHLVEEVPTEVREGDVYAMGYGMSHRFEHPNNLVLDTVHFIPTMFSPETQELLAATEGLAPLFLGHDGGEGSRWLRLSSAEHAQARGMLRDMREEWLVNAPDSALMVQAHFLRYLIFLARTYRRVYKTGAGVGAKARAVIDRRYAEPLKIGELAASAFLSMSRFSELFREEVGCAPREYLGQVRIRAAKALLRETDLSISSIATRTGFPDPAYFTRFFRQEVGVSPSEFRGRVSA